MRRQALYVGHMPFQQDGFGGVDVAVILDEGQHLAGEATGVVDQCAP